MKRWLVQYRGINQKKWIDAKICKSPRRAQRSGGMPASYKKRIIKLSSKESINYGEDYIKIKKKYGIAKLNDNKIELIVIHLNNQKEAKKDRYECLFLRVRDNHCFLDKIIITGNKKSGYMNCIYNNFQYKTPEKAFWGQIEGD